MPGVLPGVHCTKGLRQVEPADECGTLGEQRVRVNKGFYRIMVAIPFPIRGSPDRHIVGTCGRGPVAAASGNLPVVGDYLGRFIGSCGVTDGLGCTSVSTTFPGITNPSGSLRVRPDPGC